MFPPNQDQKPEMMSIRKSGRKFKDYRKVDETGQSMVPIYPEFFSSREKIEEEEDLETISEVGKTVLPYNSISVDDLLEESIRESSNSFIPKNKP